MQDLLESLALAWDFFLPATAVPAALYFWWLIFRQDSVLPIDLRKELGSGRVIGDGRGLWGLPAAFLVGILVGQWQGRVEEAVILALGADFGCLCNSYMKRRLSIPRGVSNLASDHIDFFLGACLFYVLHFPLPWSLLLPGLVSCGFAHFILSRLIRRFFRGVEPVPQVA